MEEQQDQGQQGHEDQSQQQDQAQQQDQGQQDQGQQQVPERLPDGAEHPLASETKALRPPTKQ